MNKSYHTRSALFFFLLCSGYGMVVSYLYIIQVIRHEFFIQLGKKQYEKVITTYPPRGIIFDRTGKNYLAVNKKSLAAFILPKEIESKEQLLQFIHTYFPDRYAYVVDNMHKSFIYLKRRLTQDEIDLIENSRIADIHLLSEPSRFYPFQSTSTVVGVANIDTVGISGIELLFNDHLTGKPTECILQKDARSGHYYFTRQQTADGVAGNDLILTLDSDLQFIVQEEVAKTMEHFDATEGAALIIDPKTGQVLVMVSLPTYNPNNLHGVNPKAMKNNTVAASYELGSVIKTFSALAALDEEVVTLHELIDCEEKVSTYIAGRKVNTVRSTVAGVIPFSQVIEKSNNIGIAKVVMRLNEKLYDHYQKIGFGVKTGIEFPGEQSGFVNQPWCWSKQSIFSLSYGYELTATLLQLARAFCVIANDGYPVKLTLLFKSDAVGTRKISTEKPLYPLKSIKKIKKILENTVLHGTAQRAKIKGYRVMSKTGTANLLDNGVYSDKKNIYTCAGIIEKDEYCRVVVAFIKEAKGKNLYASTVAAPLLEAIAEKMIIHEKVL